jgi:putative PIN family toxin of toxin-antitoxin system
VKVLLDTNVLIAAFATRGLCEDVLRTVLAEHDLVLGETVLGELERVLVAKLGMPIERARSIAQFLRDQGVVVNPSEPASLPQDDPDDRWILAAAMEGEVDALVTGDRHLLDVADKVSVTIVSPRGFWEKLR